MVPKTIGVKIVAVMSAARPLFPQEQTIAGTHRTSVSCQSPPNALQRKKMATLVAADASSAYIGVRIQNAYLHGCAGSLLPPERGDWPASRS